MLLVIGSSHNFLAMRMLKPLSSGVARPELLGSRKLIHGEGTLPAGKEIVLNEALAIGAIRERNIERLSVSHALLQAGVDRVIGIFGLDDSDRDVRGVHEKVVGLLLVLTGNHIPAYNDLAIGKVVLGKDLGVTIPRLHNRGID